MKNSIVFAPHLYLTNVAAAVEFYQRAFGAVERRRWSNDDQTIHVAEMAIDDAIFHLHEESPHANRLSPASLRGVTTLITIFTPNPDILFNAAAAAGGVVLSPMQDFDYGYRQGIVADPFGHQWLLQTSIAVKS